MAEEKLEGFEDFENVLGEGEGGAEADFGGELDDLLSEGADAGEAAPEAGPADSELDSFFEDLSTIDDLEVLQEDEEAPAAAEVAAEVAVPAPEAAVERAAPEPRPREKKKRGLFGRLLRWLIVLGILLGGGYYLYLFFFPDFPLPWQVMEEEKDKLISLLEEKLQPAPPLEPAPRPPTPAPAVAPPPKPRPAPVVRPAKPPPERGRWSIQVATCFFPSCLDGYRSYLQAHQRSVLVREKRSNNESLEIYSVSTYGDREQAQELADRINKNHPLEGHAYIFREKGGYKISMGTFADLARTNVIKDALNEQFFGDVGFVTRLKTIPYKLKSVMTGRYPSRRAAQAALAKLRDEDPRFKDAFVTGN